SRLDLPTGSRDYNPNATRFETGTVDAAAFVGLRQTLVVHRLFGSWVSDRVRALRRRLLERIAELPFVVRSTPEAPTGIVVVEPGQGYVAGVGASRNAPELDDVAKAIKRAGGKALAQTADIADERQVQELVLATERWVGPATILVNNAGMVDPMVPLARSNAALWLRSVAIN